MKKIFLFLSASIVAFSGSSFANRKPSSESLVVNIDSTPIECSISQDELTQDASFKQFANYAVQYLNSRYASTTEVQAIQIIFASGENPHLIPHGSGQFTIKLKLDKNDPDVWFQLGHELGHLINPTLIHPIAEGFASVVGFEIAQKCRVPYELWRDEYTDEATPTVHGTAYRMFRDLGRAVSPENLSKLIFRDSIQNWLDQDLNARERSHAFAALKAHYATIYSLRHGYTVSAELPFEVLRNHDNNEVLDPTK